MPVEADIGWYALTASLLVVVALEYVAPARTSVGATIRERWPVNFGLWVLGIGVMSVHGWAFSDPSFGLADNPARGSSPLATLPGWLAFIVTLAVADLAYYGWHVLEHRWPLLWRFHRVHHADVEYDFTTSFRFHPVEVLMTAVVSGVVIAALGAPPEAVAAYLLIRQSSDAIGHGNVRVPGWIDRVLRVLVVTPNVHRVHHSPDQDETDSNFGGLVTLWDRLFGTYRAEPRLGHAAMAIGLRDLRAPDDQTLKQLLTLPFRYGPRPR